MDIDINSVVQFNENHEWCGCLGIVEEIKDCVSSSGKVDKRYTVSVKEPLRGTAFIYCMESEKSIEYIGKAILTRKDDD